MMTIKIRDGVRCIWNQFDYKFVTDANGDGMPDDKKSYSLTSFVLTKEN